MTNKQRKDFIDGISSVVNRSIHQTEFLLNLCDNDAFIYMTLEMKIKNNFVIYCPGDKEEVEKILSIETDKTNLLNFHDMLN